MKFLLLFLSTILFQSAFSQDPAFQWNQANSKPAMQLDVKILGDGKGGFYQIYKEPLAAMEFNPKITVDYLNTKLERVFKKNVTPFNNMEDYVNTLLVGGKLYVFTAVFSKEAGKYTLSATGIRDDGAAETPVVITSQNAEKLSQRGRFTVASSPDGSKLLVVSEPNFTKGEMEKISFMLMDGKLSKIWSSDQTYGYEWTRAVENNPFVNNDGVVYILKKTDMKGDDNTYSVFSFKGKALKEFKITLDGKKKIHTHVEAFSPEGDFTVGGYYTEDSKVKVGFGTALHGSYLWRIGKDGESALISAINPFDKRKDIIAKYMLFDDNRTLLLGEKYYVNTQSAAPDPNIPPAERDPFAKDYTYYGLDMFVDGYDVTGKPLYASSLSKNNNSKNDNGTWVSYFAAIVNHKLYLIFNDEKSNYDEKKKAIVFGSNRVGVFAVMDPQTGVLSPGKPIPNMEPVGGKGSDMLMRPDVFMKVDNTHYLIRAENRETYREAMVSF